MHLIYVLLIMRVCIVLPCVPAFMGQRADHVYWVFAQEDRVQVDN